MVVRTDGKADFFQVTFGRRVVKAINMGSRSEWWELWDLPRGAEDGTEVRFDWTSDRDTAHALVWERLGF